LGYKNVQTYIAGIPGWVAAGYRLDTSQAVPKVEIVTINSFELNVVKDSVNVVDIRNIQEVSDMGEFQSAMHIPLEELDKRYVEIPKGKPIVLIDYSGVEFICAGAYLKNMGFEDVRGLQGGVKDWIKQGFSLAR